MSTFNEPSHLTPASRPRVIWAREVWRLGWSSLVATKRQVFQLLGLGLLLPQALATFALDQSSTPVAAALRHGLGTNRAAGVLGLDQLLAPMLPYASQVGLSAMILAIMGLATYLAVVQTAVDFHRGLAPRGAWQAWRLGLVHALRGGLIGSIVLIVLMGLGQLFVVPAVLIGITGLAWPVIMVAEEPRGIRALWRSLSLRYLRGSGISPWTVLLQLLLIGTTAYTLLGVLSLGNSYLLGLDEYLDIPKALWSATFPGVDFGPVYLAVSMLDLLAITALSAMVATLTASCYFSAVGRRTLGQA